MKNLACKIRSMRERHNFTQEFMASELDISVKTYQRIEAGKSLPSLPEGIMLARIFEVSLDEFRSDYPDLTQSESLPESPSTALKHLLQENADLSERLRTVGQEKDRLPGIIESLLKSAGRRDN